MHSRQINRAGTYLALYVLLACALGCVREATHPVIVVSTTGLAAEVRSLEIDVLLGKTAANERYTLLAEEAVFSAQLPEGARGEATVRIRGLDERNCLVSSGQGSVLVSDVGRYDLTVSLVPLAAPSCLTSVELSFPGRKSDLRLLALTVRVDETLLLGRDLRPATAEPLLLDLGTRMSGQLSVEVSGLGCRGCTLQNGSGQLRLERAGRYTLAIPMTDVQPAQCPPALGRLLEPRQGHGAVLLGEGSGSGSVLMLAGDGPRSMDSVELYDPYRGSSRMHGRLLEPRNMHTTVLFKTGPLRGKVMLIGGYVGQFLKSVELYDPETGTSRPLAPLHDAVNGHSATLLPDGRVVVIGGHNSMVERRTVEVFDPTSETWSLADNAPVTVYLHSATLLRDGRILVAGGYVQQTSTQADTAAVLDLGAQSGKQWIEAGRLSQPRYHHRDAVLADGKVLILGGFRGDYELAASEQFDPVTLRFQSAAPMFYRRASQTVTPLSSGALYLPGGVNWYLSAAYSTAELYDPAQSRSLATPGLQVKRGAHAATLLPGDGVLLSGGFVEPLVSGSTPISDSVELTYPLDCSP